jgi:hypothetical protein
MRNSAINPKFSTALTIAKAISFCTSKESKNRAFALLFSELKKAIR